MMTALIKTYTIDYIEIYTPMAKPLAYWHIHALGFRNVAYSDPETGNFSGTSIVLESKDIRLVLTSAFPTAGSQINEVTSFIAQNYCGVKKIAFKVSSVKEVFEQAVNSGAFPISFPTRMEDDFGYVEEASIKLYDHSEIVFTNRDSYKGAFKPGYRQREMSNKDKSPFLNSIDHIASEVRVNERDKWSGYLSKTLGIEMVQSINKGSENKTGMTLNISQSNDQNVTFVIAEPDISSNASKVQQNIDKFGPGIHHLAFATGDIMSTVAEMTTRGVDFVSFPPSYYDLLRKNSEFEGMDINALETNGIVVDKEGDTWLFQKFLKPITDRPFFLYEIVQRVNGYRGFALKNINVLKKAEELEIMRKSN